MIACMLLVWFVGLGFAAVHFGLNNKYTTNQYIVYSLTWFIWFIRAGVRWLRDAVVHIWRKWKDE